MSWHFVLVKALTHILRDIFEGGYYADKVLERAFKNNKQWGKRDRQFLAETTYDMVRWWGLLQFYDRQAWIPKDYYLRWAFYEAWKNKADTVEFLKTKNISLEYRFDQIKNRIEKTALKDLERVSFPPWLFEKFKNQYGDEAVGLMESLNLQAAVFLRVNTLKTSLEKLIASLKAEDIEVNTVEGVTTALKLTERKNVFTTTSFKNGFFEMQDTASQRVAAMLAPNPGERVADVCAGAGGKTLHLAMLMENKGTLLASDVSEKKLEQLKLRARRAGVSNLRIQLAESTKDLKKHFGSFDKLLIDAPCSGSGVFRRNPDSKWKLLPEDLENLLKTQSEILDTYSKFLKPGGALVYATCSLFKEENEDQVEDFLKSHPEFKLKESFNRRPDLHDEDGFYAALLVRG